MIIFSPVSLTNERATDGTPDGNGPSGTASTVETRPKYPQIHFDATYLTSTPGGPLKIVQIVLDIIIMICVGCDWGYYYGGGGYTDFAAGFSMLLSLLLLIFYLLNLIYRFLGPWILIEMIDYAICAALHLIAMIVYASISYGRPAGVAAAVFTALAVIAYSLDAVFQFLLFRQQGGYLTSPTRRFNKGPAGAEPEAGGVPGGPVKSGDTTKH